jgi:hypothetical protein
MDRRKLLSGILGSSVCIAAGKEVSPKKLIASPESQLLVIELLDTERLADPTEEEVARICKRVQDKFGLKAFVVPHGTKVSLISPLYVREKLGEYEYECGARTAEELKDVMKDCGINQGPHSLS